MIRILAINLREVLYCYKRAVVNYLKVVELSILNFVEHFKMLIFVLDRHALLDGFTWNPEFAVLHHEPLFIHERGAARHFLKSLSRRIVRLRVGCG